MNKTSVTISARGARASGKSTLLTMIREVLLSSDHGVEAIYTQGEHSVQFLLPQGFAERVVRRLKDGDEAAELIITHQRGVIEKWNEIDQANEKEKAELRTDLDGTRIARDQAIAAERRAVAARDAANEEMAELKSRLHEAETQLARMRGYVDRVHDLDEIGREPLTTVTERTERPRRSAGNSTVMALSGDGCASNGARRRHWTSYGQ